MEVPFVELVDLPDDVERVDDDLPDCPLRADPCASFCADRVPVLRPPRPEAARLDDFPLVVDF
jgi:hypothetical protein